MTTQPTDSLEDKLFQELLNLCEAQEHKINPIRIQRAYQFAREAHHGQFRQSGEPYICHPLETAKTLASLGADEDSIVTGILHDVPEDTKYTVQDVENRFGKSVAGLVSALTKLSRVYYKHSMGSRQVQSLRKMFLETSNDPRVIVIKLADRLHNMSTLQYLRPDKQQRIARETLEIHAPLANLYGIYKLRRQLEDYCFMYLQPDEYERVKSFVHDYEKKRNHFIEESIQVIKKSLKRAGIEAELEGRPKHYYSIYQKMVRDQKILQDIYDYFAIRIVTTTPEECYQALGAVHKLFKPKPQRFKDYIALPKPNGYQALHTTVIGLRGKLTEVQIRTKSMHHNAEFGVAAHVYYKGGQGNAMLAESVLQLKQYKNPEQFIRGLQEDVLQDKIFVFSPTGDILNLPEGATCLDYIYAQDLPIDKKITRVVVNNRTYSITGSLQSGDRIEIIYGQQSVKGPERWWLGHVKTAKAKTSISTFLEKQDHKDLVFLGEKLIQQELDHESRGLLYQLPTRVLSKALTKYKVQNFEEILAHIGSGQYEASDVYSAMFSNIEVGAHRTLIRFLRKILHLRGGSPEHTKYTIRILILANDRVGLLKDILNPFYLLSVPIINIMGKGGSALRRSASSYVENDKQYVGGPKSKLLIDADVDSHEDLIRLFDRLEKVPGVFRVQRVFQRYQVIYALLFVFTATYFALNPLLLLFLQKKYSLDGHLLSEVIVYTGFFSLLVLLSMLKSIGHKTFPHFEETRFFWFLAFGLVSLTITSLFVNNFFYDLDLFLPTMFGVSFLVVCVCASYYFSHQRRRQTYLQSLSEKVKKIDALLEAGE